MLHRSPKMPARARSVVVASVVATLAWLWAACAPSDLGPTCRFSGDDSSPCGQCIATSCQQHVDACCASERCSEKLSSLDQCASGTSCASISSVSSALADCVVSACPMCGATRDGGTKDSGSRAEAGPRYTSDCGSLGKYGCICSPGGGRGSDTECSASSVGGYCCAERGWPSASDTSCSCAPFTCEPVVGSPYYDVRCKAEDLHTGITEATGSKCCIDVFLEECKCGPFDMGCEPENVVPRCSAEVMRCISSRSLVTSCSY